MAQRTWTTEQMIEIARSAARGERRVREIVDGAPVQSVPIDEVADLVERTAAERFPKEYAERWPTK